MSDLIEQAKGYIDLVMDDRNHSNGDEIMERLISRIKELEIERDQFMEQAGLRDQRDADMQEIMKINNALKVERDTLADHLARAQAELARFLRPLHFKTHE